MNNNDSRITLSKNAIDFLMYSYFNFTTGELKCEKRDYIALKCAQRAYLDLCRTLSFSEKTTGLKGNAKKDVEQIHRDFRNKICDVICTAIIGRLLCANNGSDFDKQHEAVCKEIVIEASRHSKDDITTTIAPGTFKDGHAQKWLNMTLKYMWLLGLWSEAFEEIIEYLHVPVDRYVINAVWNEKDIPLPITKGSRDRRGYSDYADHVKVWSKWEYSEYFDFQKALRESLKRKKTPPFEWEHLVWIKGAESQS